MERTAKVPRLFYVLFVRILASIKIFLVQVLSCCGKRFCKLAGEINGRFNDTRVLNAGTPNYIVQPALAQFFKRQDALSFQPDKTVYQPILEEADDTDFHWYPMRISYAQRERALGIRDELARQGYEVYLHLQDPSCNAFGEVREDNSRYSIYNMVFVRAMKIQLKLLKRFDAVCSRMKFIPVKSFDATLPKRILWIPDQQMNDFRDAATRPDPDQQRINLTYQDFLDRPHQKVRILSGPFEGLKGEVVRINRHRIFVALIREAKVAVGITHTPPSNLEILSE